MANADLIAKAQLLAKQADQSYELLVELHALLDGMNRVLDGSPLALVIFSLERMAERALDAASTVQAGTSVVASSLLPEGGQHG